MGTSQSKVAAQMIVIGGMVIDLYFSVPRWPEQGEAVEIYQDSFQFEAGGKGLNQAVACSRLGLQTIIVSSIGSEKEYCDELFAALKGEKNIVSTEYVHKQLDAGTDITAVIVSSGEPGFIGCRRATNKLTPYDIDQALPLIEAAEVVLITFDISPQAARRAIEIARSAGKRIVINASPPSAVPLELMKGIDYVVLSEREARKWLELCEKPHSPLPQDDSEISFSDQIGDRLLKYRPKAVILTEVTQGCILIEPRVLGGNKPFRRYRQFIVPAVDATGASDAFCAGLAFSLIEQRTTVRQKPRPILLASAAGALASAKKGAYPSMPTFAEVEQFLRDQPEKSDDELEIHSIS